MTDESTVTEKADRDVVDVAMDRVGEVQTVFVLPDAMSAEDADRLKRDLILAIKTVYDPEIPADIYELGLIYKVALDADKNIDIDMTLTAPGCPVAGEMPGWVENAISTVAGIGLSLIHI